MRQQQTTREPRVFDRLGDDVIDQLEYVGHAVVRRGMTEAELDACIAQFAELASAFASPDKHDVPNRQRLLTVAEGAVTAAMVRQRDELLEHLFKQRADGPRFRRGTDVFSVQLTEPGGETRVHRDADDIVFATLASQVTGGRARIEVWDPVDELKPPTGPAPYEYESADGMTLLIRNTWPWSLPPESEGGVFHRVSHPPDAPDLRRVATIASRLSVADTIAIHLHRKRGEGQVSRQV